MTGDGVVELRGLPQSASLNHLALSNLDSRPAETLGAREGVVQPFDRESRDTLGLRFGAR